MKVTPPPLEREWDARSSTGLVDSLILTYDLSGRQWINFRICGLGGLGLHICLRVEWLWVG